MPSSPDGHDPSTGPRRRDASAVDVSVVEAEARYHRDRLALYRARMHGPKATSVGRLEELERAAAAAEERLTAARRRTRG